MSRGSAMVGLFVLCPLVSTTQLGQAAEPLRPSLTTCTNGTAANMNWPRGITIVQSTSGTPDPIGTFTVVIRDLANVPVGNSPVRLDLSNCPVRICQDQLDPNATVYCSGTTKQITKYTDVAGRATFTVLGFSTGASAVTECSHFDICTSGIGSSALYITVVAVLDLDGSGSLTASDLSTWQSDYFSGYSTRSDYNYDGSLTPADYSLLLSYFFAGGSLTGCTSANSCP